VFSITTKLAADATAAAVQTGSVRHFGLQQVAEKKRNVMMLGCCVSRAATAPGERSAPKARG
jgi:hypothetical protein